MKKERRGGRGGGEEREVGFWRWKGV